MEIGVNSETVGSFGGAAGLIGLLKTFWTDYWNRQDRKEWEEKLQAQFKRLDQQDEEIAQHAVLDAQTYATREEQRALLEHFDKRFDNIQALILGLRVQSQNGK
jgi:hypothetical protein